MTGIKELFVREQFINACPKDLAIHLRERELPDLKELTRAAGRFLTAHNRNFYFASTLCESPEEEANLMTSSLTKRSRKLLIQCFLYMEIEH